jgi:CcmD family protein
MSVRRVIVAVAVLSACLGGIGADRAALAQPQRPPAAQEEFVPLSELPPDDTLPAAPMLIAAYAFVWLAILFYVWRIWRRMGRLEQELTDAIARVDRPGPQAP